MKIALLALTLSALTLSPGAAFSAGPPGAPPPPAHKPPHAEHGGMGKGGMGMGMGMGMGKDGGPAEMMARCMLDSPELNLTKDQRVQVLTIGDDLSQAMRMQAPKMHMLHGEFFKAFADPKMGADDLKKKAAAVHEGMAACMDMMFEGAMKVRGVLTADQMKKFADLPCADPSN